jgi:hypothetical protein
VRPSGLFKKIGLDVGLQSLNIKTIEIVNKDSFNFSHRSFMEYFIARWVWDCTNSQHDGLIDEDVIRQYLPRRELNIESTNFAREIWQALYSNMDTKIIALRQSVYVWRWLQCAGVSDTTVEIHTALFKLILALGLVKKTITQLAIESHGKYLIKNQTINLQNLEFIQERWEDLDFSPLPSIDFSNANLLCLRAWRCNFGRMQCEGGNWAQTVFRDCEMGGIDWGSADKGGMMIRYGEKKPITKALKGPWTQDSRIVNHFIACFISDLDIIAVTKNNVTIFDLITGRYKKQKQINIDYEPEIRLSIDCKYLNLISDSKVITLDFKTLEKTKIKLFEFPTYLDSIPFEIINNDKFSIINVFDKKERLIRKVSVTFDVEKQQHYNGNRIFKQRYSRFNPYAMNRPQSAKFDVGGNLLDYDDEAADTWLFCLASGRSEPVETAMPVD